jgi:cystathionine gamma-synthase
MPQENLRNHPLCHAEDLGKPIPPTPHAISMCLPRWKDVIGYEERDPETMAHLQVGYPRFFYHPLVEQVCEQFKRSTDEQVQIYSTRSAAERCKAYLLRNNPSATLSLRSIENSPTTLISFPIASADHAKEYWQHAGEGISSRCAEALLNNIPVPEAAEAQRKIIDRIAEFTGADQEHVYLFPSGMAAVNAAFLAIQDLQTDRPTVQFAFPYGDTLKLQEKMGRQNTLFYPRGDATDLQALKKDLSITPISGLFCEFPTNPLLTSVDLSELRKLADEYQFPVIIDETLGACINQNTLPFSDVSVISLTKFFSGTSDVMGGALIINHNAPFAAKFTKFLKTLHEAEAFNSADLIQLELDSRNYRERVEQSNQTALEVCSFLNQHPEIESIYYPAFTDRELYDQAKLPGGGYGGLFSFVLKNAAAHTEAFYDALEITKGPNLGTSFSLCCPFTLIAHYNELEWAESAGASRYLIRISVGLEPASVLVDRIQTAIDIALRS